MSGAEKITQKIIEDAKEQAKAALAAAEAQCAELAEAGKIQAEKQVQAMAERAREQGRDLVRRREAVCSLELRKETLALKRSLLEEAFQRAEEQLRTAEEDAYAQMMARLLAECAEQLGDGEVRLAAREGRLQYETLLAQARDILRRRSLAVRMEQGPVTDALEDGFLYVGDGAEINCSLANIVNQRKAELEAEVCRILFQE